jgi:hypothetical protein
MRLFQKKPETICLTQAARPTMSAPQVITEEAENRLRGYMRRMPGTEQWVEDVITSLNSCNATLASMYASIPTTTDALPEGIVHLYFTPSRAVTALNGSNISALANDAGYLVGSALTPYLTSASAASTYATQGSLTSGLAGKEPTITAGTTAQYWRGDKSWQPFPTIPVVTRTTSVDTIAFSGTGATGAQVHATKDSTVRYSVSTSTTSTIGGPGTSAIALKICATNDATEANWTTVGTFESDQTITLAIILNSIQVVKGQICADVPAGWYRKLVNSGSGTHTETFLSGQKTIYG